MDEIIAGKFVLVPGTYIGLKKGNFEKVTMPLHIEICRKCANEYLPKFGYRLTDKLL